MENGDNTTKRGFSGITDLASDAASFQQAQPRPTTRIYA